MRTQRCYLHEKWAKTDKDILQLLKMVENGRIWKGPLKPVKPLTPTRDTLYPGQGYRVSRVGVRVGLAYPRVTRAIP